MKHAAFFLAFLLIFILRINSQENKMNLVQTEYAFAEVTKNSSVRDGFLQFIENDGILFRPGPVNGKEFLENSEAQPGLLLWYPTASFISSSGDLGVNTGPWEFKRSADEEPVAFGEFLTVWEKQSDGVWKFIIDLGIGYPKSEETKDGIENSVVINKYKSTKNYDDILQIEKSFNSASAKENYNSIIDDNTTFLRNNRVPINNEMKDEFLSQLGGTAKWKTLDGKSSEANDLAYTYGKGTVLDNKMNTMYGFYYVHVWINNNGNWKLLYDVVSEIKQEK